MEQGSSGNIGLRLVAVVSDVDGQRTYRSPRASEERLALDVPDVDDFPEIPLPDIPRWFSGPRFGVKSQADLYTPRQLLMLSVLPIVSPRSGIEFCPMVDQMSGAMQ